MNDDPSKSEKVNQHKHVRDLKMIQQDRFVSNVLKETPQTTYHFDNQQMNQNHSKCITDQATSKTNLKHDPA